MAATKVSGKSYEYQTIETVKGFGLPVADDYDPERSGFLRFNDATDVVEKFVLGTGWLPIAGANNYPTTLTYELGQLTIGRNGLSALTVTIDKAALGLDLVENVALSTWTGSDNITNVGVITDGVWNGMAISPLKGGIPPGGTVGQVIKKLSSTDYDLDWADEGAGGGGGSSAWGGITGTLSDQIDLITALNGKQPSDADLTAIAGLTPSNDDIIQRKSGAWTNRTLAQYKVDLLLNNVDNTSDINKPVSTLQAAAIALKQDILVSGTNIKTINGNSLLGSGNITISGGTAYTFSDGLFESGGAVSIPTNGITGAKINAGAVNNSKISDVAWGKITGTPTTVSGYGITDAVTLTGAQTITNKTINGSNNTLSNIALGSLAQTGATLNQIIRWNGTSWAASPEASGGSVYTFTTADFNESGSTISLDYVNGQSASSSTKGYLTAADWLVFNGKQNQITSGSTAQYFRGDLSLAAFPTNISTWVNDSGYLVNITGKVSAGSNIAITGLGTTASPYVISSTATGVADGDKGDIVVSASGSSWVVDTLAITNAKINDVAWTKITGTPTTVSGYGITDAVTLTGTQTLTNKTLTTPKINLGTDATGDVYTRDSSGNLVRIPIGSAGQVLKVVSGLPAWAADAVGGGGGATLSDGDYGDVTVSATGTAIFIDNGVVTNAKLANVATATLKGRATAGTGAVEDLTSTQATALLNVFTSTLKGLVPLSGGGTVNFLRADGTWAAPSGGTTYTFTPADFNESGSTVSIDYVNGQKATGSIAGFLSAADWTTFNSKQPTITTGSTAQYFRGDLSLASFPTSVSTFTNDAGYLTNVTGKITAGTNVSISGSGTTGSPYVVSATLAGTVTGVGGTTNRITSTGGATPVIDISALYVGQTSIITLGTITTGTWNGSAIASGYGGVPTGGTAGQVLAKINGTNYATQWIPAPTLELVPGFGIIIDGENNISVDPDILAGGGITAITGDIAASGSGSVTGTIQANAVTTAKIADANVTNAKIASVAWSKITSTPTTVAGYGITDAATLTGVQTLTNKTLTSPKINLGSDATGDTYYRDSSGNLVRLAVGSNGQVLKITSGLPAWGTDISGGGGVSDGTYADIAISSTGSIYTITAGAVTNSKVAAGIDAVKLADGSVTNAELQFINSLTSNAQSQIDGKQATLVSGTNIKTVNGTSLLGSGNITIAGLTDGNYSDWTVSGTGTIATINANAVTTSKINNDAVTYAKIQNVAADRMIGRIGTSGDMQEIPLGAGIAFSSGSLISTVEGLSSFYIDPAGLTNGPGSTEGTAITLDTLAALAPTSPINVYLKSGVTHIGKITLPKGSKVSRYGTGNNPVWSGAYPSANYTWTQAGTIWSTTVPSRVGRVLRNGAPEKTAQSSFYQVTSKPGANQITASGATGLSNVTQMEMITKEYEFRWSWHSITAYNSGSGTFTLDSNDGIVAGYYFRLFNHESLIAADGDWAWRANTLYYRSPGNVNPNTLNVDIAVHDEAIILEEGGTGYDIDGITFYAQAKDAIYGKNVNSVYITNTFFRKQLNHAVALVGSNQNVSIKNNGVEGVGFSGISSYTLRNFDISYNNVENVGVQVDPPFTRDRTARYDNIYSVNAGIMAGTYSAYGTIYGNTLRNLAYIGVRVDGHDVKTNLNKVYNFSTRQNDGGGLYTNGNNGDGTSQAYNLEFTNNYCEGGVGGSEGGITNANLSAGLYIDNYTTITRVSNNTFVENGGFGIYVGGTTKDHLIKGNIFYGNKRAQIGFVNWQNFDAFAYTTNNVRMEGNTLTSLSDDQFTFQFLDFQNTSFNPFSGGGYASDNIIVAPYNSVIAQKYYNLSTLNYLEFGDIVSTYSQPFGFQDTYAASYSSLAASRVNTPLKINDSDGVGLLTVPADHRNPGGRLYDPTVPANNGAVFINEIGGGGGGGNMYLENVNNLSGVGAIVLPYTTDVRNLSAGAWGIQGVGVHETYQTMNARWDGVSNYKYLVNGYASQWYYGAGNAYFYTAASGTAGGNVTMNERLSIANNGNVKINALDDASGVARMVVSTNGVLSYDTIPGGGGGSSQWDDITYSSSVYAGVNYAGNAISLNTTSPFPGLTDAQRAYGMDISGGVLMFGGNEDNLGGRTDNGGKAARLLIPHYTNAEQPVGAMIAGSNSTANFLLFGGGTSLANAATTISFYTAANTTTTTGTERMKIDSSGNITFSSIAGNGVGVVSVDNDGNLGWTAGGGGGGGDVYLANENTFTGTAKIILPTLSGNTNLRVGSWGMQARGTSEVYMFMNAHFDGVSDYKYDANGYASLWYFGSGSAGFYSAPSGTAGANATMTERLSMSASGVKINNAYTLPTAAPGTNGYVLYANTDGSMGWVANGSGGSGTVTSVAASVPSFLSVSGSPVTTTGTLAISYSGTALPAANGGTGQTSYTTGDLLYASGSSALSKLAAGTSGYYLGANGAGTAPSWKELPGSGQDGVYTILSAITSSTTETAMTGSMQISVGEAGLLEVTVYAVNSGNTASFSRKLIVAYRGTGSSTAEISVHNNILAPSFTGSGMEDCDISYNYNGSGDFVMSVFGIGGMNIQWRAEVKKYSVYWSS